ncbi:hypothetical protein N9H97_03650 [Gammaproteobacteria bacterium]|nr:hypothetical protein [Gammaproteobacteria bacterium]
MLKKYVFCVTTQKDLIEYLIYLVDINSYRANYLDLLRNCNIEDSIDAKKDWANFIIINSKDRLQKENAKEYLDVLRSNLYETVFDQRNIVVNDGPPKKFFILGPNSTTRDFSNYSDHQIVHLKPFQSSLDIFSNSILFLNDYTYSALLLSPDRIKKIISSYDKIYVSSQAAEIKPPFFRAKFLPQGFISSGMALQRVIFNILSIEPKCSLCIDGFDLFLSKNPYSDKRYLKFNRSKNNITNEKDYAMSLAEHDFIYNFMLTKKLLSGINITGSKEFIEILNYPLKDYVNKILRNRDFTII